MNAVELMKWKSNLTRQQYSVLKAIWRRSCFGLWTRYRNLFDVCNSPTSRIHEIREAGVPLKCGWTKVKNSTGRLVKVEEFKV